MNIPEVILKKVRVATRLQEEEFNAYLELLQKEGDTYCRTFLITDEVEQTVLNLCVELYVQYQLFSKIEYEDISKDKLDTLHSIINSFNNNYNKKQPTIAKGVQFI